MEPSDAGGLSADAALELLRTGEIAVEGRLVEASNATLFCAVSGGDARAHCVYKPVRGERPLWDFPDGTLAAREYAAYELSEQLGDGLVPPTVLRDGPFGVGMAQLWIDVDETVDMVGLVRAGDWRLRRVALFDAVINNADRKGGHLLPAPSGRVYAIDHGVTFHGDDKLRTVLWNWRGKRFDAAERALLDGLGAALDGPLGEKLDDLLTQSEIAALAARVDRLRDQGRFPQPSDDWPAIPWPPF
ncbi:phosphatidylinositol kinase [Pseudofrankia asymbiotica]|uniref:Phosphatidylinositol kinase n=1 Tax=Pseudofrankia asymbiotica TaxID=1834516 RepID=A0A1V2IIJ0_9ACTN|nr:phosphatidylinositol kinase [Pseudofrankia asymbiotica]